MKDILKRSFATFAIAAALAGGIQTIQPQSSHAFIILAASDQIVWPEEALWVYVSCVLFLPFCLFEEQGFESAQSMSVEDLMDNAYTREEAELILKDQARLLAKLHESRSVIQIEVGDSIEDVRSGLEVIVPGLSDLYVDFLAGNAGIQ